MKLIITFLGLANAKFFNENKFLGQQMEKLELDVPFEFKSAVKLLLSHYSPIIDFPKLENHGCWCSKMNPENLHFIGDPVDELDKACKDWIHARNCLNQEGSCKHTSKAFYQSIHRYFSYTKYLGKGEWQFQMSPRMSCVHTGNHCRTNTCKIDVHFLTEIFAIAKDQSSYSNPLDVCQLPSPKKLAKVDSLTSSEIQISENSDSLKGFNKSEIEVEVETEVDKFVTKRPVQLEKQKKEEYKKQFDTQVDDDSTVKTELILKAQNDPTLFMQRAFSGPIEEDSNIDLMKGNSFEDSTPLEDLVFDGGDLDLDMETFFDSTEDDEWMSFVEDISYQKKKPQKQNCISLLTKMNINL